MLLFVWLHIHLVQFCYDDRTAVRADRNIANTWAKLKEKRWKWTAMGHRFAKMSNAFDGAWLFEFSTVVDRDALRLQRQFDCIHRWKREKKRNVRVKTYGMSFCFSCFQSLKMILLWQARKFRHFLREKKPGYQWIFFLVVCGLWEQLILWIDAVTSRLSFAWVACSVKRTTPKRLILCQKFTQHSSIYWRVTKYLFASEWATSASSSRLFRIFLPLDRSGTLTESIFASDSILWFPSLLFRLHTISNGCSKNLFLFFLSNHR